MAPPDTRRILDGLDEEQRTAVLAPPGPVRILAGAGTGKTRTITHRIAYQALTGAAPAAGVLAVTHSAKAASEMRDRLAALGVAGVQARTFHAAALRQLRFFWAATGRPGAAPQLVDTLRGGRYGLIRTALAGSLGVRPGDVDSTAVLELDSEVTWAHARQISPDAYPSAVTAAHRTSALPAATVAAAYAGYEHAKRAHAVLDFDDLLSVLATLLETDPDVPARVRGQYRSFVVDEYQDTDPAQQRLLDAWLGDRDTVAVVGDPSQAIYSFRGAEPHLIGDFVRRYPHAVSVALVRDYRSTPQVVAAANRLIPSVGLPLEGQQPDGPPPRVRAYPTETAETTGVADTVRRLLADGVPAAEIAVLHRFNAQGPALRAALADAGIGVAVRADDHFYTRPEIVDVLNRLHAAAGATPDAPALPTLDAALTAGGFDRDAPPAGAGAARERWETRNALRGMAAGLPDADRLSTAALAAELARRADREHLPAGGASVSVLTIHKAKGLEWDAVVLPRLTDGSLPSALATTPAELAEERRLAYVAVTRARRILECSFAERWGEKSRRSTPSEFLTAIREPRPSGMPRAAERAARGPRVSAPARGGPAPTFAVGDRLTHDTHGLGKVVTVAGAGAEQLLTVDFGAGAPRRVRPAREPVEKL